MRGAGIVLCFFLSVLMGAVGFAQAESRSTTDEIDSLLAFVERQPVEFIRNGTAHTPAEAVSHMQLKRRRAGDRIKTAEDFIRYCGTKSSFTGSPYRLRYPDGTIREAGPVLTAELKRLSRRTL